MDVGEWLKSLGLEQYEAAFHENAVDADVLRQLTADDLKELGVAAVGHRRRLLTAIAKLQADTVVQSLSRLPEVLRHARAEPMISGWTHPDRAIRRLVGRSVDACCERLSKRTTPDFIGAFGQLPRSQKVSLLPSLPSMRVWNAAQSIAGSSAILPNEHHLRWLMANDPVVRARRLPLRMPGSVSCLRATRASSGMTPTHGLCHYSPHICTHRAS